MTKASIWELESFYGTRDVIIAGSGFAGLWSAYHLKKRNPACNILIIDRGAFPEGASTRNAGFACFGSATELLDDIEMMGEEKMIELVSMRYEGLRMINKLFRKKQIGFARYGGFELISEQQFSSPELLKQQLDRLNGLLSRITGKKHVFRLANKKIAAFGFQQVSQLIENKLEGQLHAGKLVQSLLQGVHSLGVTVLNNIELKAFEPAGDQLILHTNVSKPLSARQLLLCTNSFTTELLPDAEIFPARGQILLTAPIKNLAFTGSFHYDRGFYYFRNLDGRILLGGARNKAFEEERTREHGVSEIVQYELERFLREVIIPKQSFRVEHRWSGIMGMAPQRLPAIRRVKQNVFYLGGLGGMGVALAPLMGKQVAELMTEV
ncbi:MAG: FAD-dependent oxidoreductase [Chitinophagaceae bacterium]